MKEYRIEVKVRNNMLLRQMHSFGIYSAAELSRQTNISQVVIGKYLNLTESPTQKNSTKIKASAKILADFFSVSITEIFPARIFIEPLIKNTAYIEASHEQIKQLSESSDPQNLIEQKELQYLTRKALSSLSPRQERAIRLYYGINTHEHTYNEVGKKINVSIARARQIVATGLRKLRHYSTENSPSCRQLKQLLED